MNQPLTDQEIKSILESWSFWTRPLPTSVPRKLAQQVRVTPDLVTVIQGVRRCGKSTLLQQLLDTNNINPQQAVFVNFEDPRLINYLDYNLLEQIYRHCDATLKGPLLFLFDEIQNVDQWQKWLNMRLQQQSQHSFVITGSNSQLLGGELASSLTGRYLKYELMPFDFDEYKQLEKRGNVNRFLLQGGFPATLKYPEPEKLLQQYFYDIVERDIRERVSAKSSKPLSVLAKIVFESVGSELSLRRLAGVTHLSPETVNLYLQACQDAYLLFSCSYFAFSEAKRQRHNRKYYAIDTGLRGVVSSKTGSDVGKNFENLVYLMLRKQTEKIFYWSGKHGEVDFVVESNRGITPIQVTVEEPLERHHQALEEFYRSFPQAQESVFVTLKSFAKFLQISFSGIDNHSYS